MSARVQYCILCSRWQLVLLFLWRGGGKHCSERGKSDYSASERGQKSPLNLSPQRSRNTGVVKIKGPLQGRLSNQTDWDWIFKKTTMSVYVCLSYWVGMSFSGGVKQWKTKIAIWMDKLAAQKASDSPAKCTARLTNQQQAIQRYRVASQPDSQLDRDKEQKEIKTAGQREPFRFSTSSGLLEKSYKP